MKSLLLKHKQIILYIFFGALTTAVNFAVFFILTRWLGASLVVANVMAWIIAVLFAYVTNRRWVFESKVTGFFPVLKEMCSFIAARIFSGIVDTVLMVILVDWLFIYDMTAKILVGIIVIILNFILSKWIIFRKSSNIEEP